MKTEKYYYLAIRKRNNEQDHFFLNKSFSFQELKINCYGRYWLADPFLFERDHKVYLFFEAYDLLAKRGKIGYSLIKENGECTPVRIALSRSYHMSFPYIFQWNNDIYMMPETCGNNSVQLFKAVNFPNKWEEAGMILSDVFVCDSIFLKFKEKVNLLVSEMYHGKAPNGKLFSCWVKNKVFSFDQKGLIKNKAGGVMKQILFWKGIMALGMAERHLSFMTA